MDVGYTNDPYIISQNDRFVAINSALQVDLTGQVCADSLGTKFWSGVGGQIDFVYGASLSKGGKAIIADAVGRRRRGDDPQPHPLVRDRVRSRGPLRQDLAGACTPADLHRASFGAGGAGPGRFRALGIAPPLHQGIYEIAFPHLGNSNKKRRSHERRFLHLPAHRPLIPPDGLPPYKPDAPRQRAA